MSNLDWIFNNQNILNLKDDFDFKRTLRTVSCFFPCDEWENFYDLIDGDFAETASECFARQFSKTVEEYDALDHSCYTSLKFFRDKFTTINDFETSMNFVSPKRMTIMFGQFQMDMMGLSANMTYLAMSVSDHIKLKKQKRERIKRLPPPSAFGG